MSEPAPQIDQKLRILVVDDHPAILEAFNLAFEGVPDMELASAVSSMSEALAVLGSQHVDVVVVDLALKGESGFELLKILRERHNSVARLVFSMHDEYSFAEPSLRSGANGYIMKTERMDRVLRAIREVARGDIYLSARLRTRVLQRSVSEAGRKRRGSMADLSETQFAILQMLGQGITLSEMADRLDLPQRAIEAHRRQINEELGLTSVDQLLRYAIRWTQGGLQTDEVE
ncbi:MAG TPA: response regulator transcription factor [Rhodothermales bacterium]